jgi:hypothetical protein
VSSAPSAAWLADTSNAVQFNEWGSPRARLKVEIAWGQNTGGLFTFGTSMFGGPDVLAASSWSATFGGPYDDISTDVRAVTIDRGRDTDLAAIRAGTCTITLRDANGRYNRLNGSSPLAGYLIADKPVRVTAYDNAGNPHVRFYGFIQEVEAEVAGHGTATITCVDFLDKLDTRSPVISPLGGATTGSAIGAILDWLLWTDPAMRALAIGDTLPLTYTHADGTRTGLDLIEELLQAERGIVFVNGAGAVTYVDRRARYVQPSLGTIDCTLTGFPVATDGKTIANRWTVTRTDMAGNVIGTPQVASDAVSLQKHGQIDGDPNPLLTPFLSSDSNALNLAQYLVLRTRDGILPVYEVPINVSDVATQTQVMTRDLGDRVTLTVVPRGFAQFTSDFYVESIHEEYQTQSPRHTVTWRVSSVPPINPFQFGVSLMGGPDVLYY